MSLALLAFLASATAGCSLSGQSSLCGCGIVAAVDSAPFDIDQGYM
jgi:hypothetical protein